MSTYKLLNYIFSSPQCWVKTASQCTPPSSTPTYIWSGRTLPASPTSAWHSTWTPKAGHAPASRRRQECGIAAMPNGSMCTSTAQEHRLHPCSELRTPGPGTLMKPHDQDCMKAAVIILSCMQGLWWEVVWIFWGVLLCNKYLKLQYADCSLEAATLY